MSNEKTRVLIVDDIAETRENIRKLLQFENDVEVVGAARTGKEAVELSKEIKPDVILMDINMPDMDGITATEKIKQVLPYAQIVILSVQNDPNYMRRAMMAGARDFLAKPPMVDELTAAIRRAGAMAREEKAKVAPVVPVARPGAPAMQTTNIAPASLGKVILVYSPKGGTGCTTIAVNLAASLQNKETPVALVDANLQFGDLAVFLNEQARNSILDLAGSAEELEADVVNQVMINHAVSGVKLLAAPPRPEHAESVTAYQFTKVIKFLRQMFSYIIVDTSSHLTEHVLAAIDEADLIIMVTTQDIPAIKNCRMFLDLSDILKLERKRILLVMNKFDKRMPITPERVSENFKHEVSAVVSLDERVVVPSVNRGVPFIIKDKVSPISKEILSVAGAVRKRLSELEPRYELM
ncbi:MAG: response regulator [Anaerolineales bacterium]